MSKISKFWSRGVVSAAMVLLAGTGISQAATLMIDDFTEGDFFLRDNTIANGGETEVPTPSGAGILGGERDVYVENLGVNVMSPGRVDAEVDNGSLPDNLFFETVGTTGIMRITYGLGIAPTFDLTVLGGQYIALQVDGNVAIAGTVDWRITLKDSDGDEADVMQQQTQAAPPAGGVLYFSFAAFLLDNAALDLDSIDEIIVNLENTSFEDDTSLMSLSVVSTIPEPATITLLGLGLLGSAAASRRRRKAAKTTAA